MNELLERQECKNIQKQLLVIADDICKKNNLNYYMAYGTMLGAIRHKGYIPWDDDIDIYMERSHYEEFIKIIRNCETTIPEWCNILTISPDTYYYPFAKLVDSRTVAKMDSNVTEHGVWIDIFPIDGVPNNVIISHIFCFYCHFLRAIIIAMTTDFSSKKLGKKVIYKKILATIAEIIGKNKIANIYNEVCKKYNVKDHEYVASLSGAYSSRERMPKNVYFERATYEFEEYHFSGAKNYKEYLSQLYGDFMKLPPEEKRRIHSIIAWKRDK